jgi:Clp amino terminal domain, pathogenicity island component
MLGAFTGQAHDLILLAEDEARMLGRLVVDPDHLLLALTRHGRVRSVLAERGVTGSDVYAVIVRRSGVGDDLALGAVPRSRATDRVLERAVDVAAERGVLGPSSEHLLLALASDPELEAAAVLNDLGIDATALVDAMAGERREPVSPEGLKQWLLRAAGRSTNPQPGSVVPAFERYTAEAQRAVRAASEIASLLEHHYVGPLHLLLGCLHVPGSLAAGVLDVELGPSDMGTVGEAMERARMYGPNPAHQATGIFTPEARQIVAQGALGYAYRHDDPWIGTGHLLLATLDAHDRAVDRIVGSGVMGSGPVNDLLARTLTRALPGDEQLTGTVDGGGIISFDVLIRILTNGFRELLPPGWSIRGSGRSDGIRLRVPESRSEEDYAIHMGWIVASDRAGRERLLTVTQTALADLQSAVIDVSGAGWPSPDDPDRPSEPRAEITGDPVNPRLRLFYGSPGARNVELAPPNLLNSVLYEQG